MTLRDAEKIVQDFGSVPANESVMHGLASCSTRLPHQPGRIVQAMKLWLARDIQHRSLTQEFCNEIWTAASRLPFFIEDEAARRINATRRELDFSRAERANLSTQEFIARSQKVAQVQQWISNTEIRASSLHQDLTEFIAAVQRLDPAEPLFWQKVYTFAGLEYPPTRNQF